MAFADRLVALRKERSLTQQALADRSGIHVTLLRRYESGRTQPSLDALRRIALALNASADLLVFEEGERGPSDEFRGLFEAVSQLDERERDVLRTVIEGVLLKHDARRWTRTA
ncbi:MAG: helix-turn-helix transcriptional regulator [Candidatus Dormibacteraeota bacterium]|nr:helix-turn-helix transcriptional regulator [Candidatus Dormibacteraeota bacterium]